MADKVDAIMERMLDEFNFYQDEELFSRKEIRNIVNQRREQEYSMQRKDATVPHFLEAIKYENELWSRKKVRKEKHKGKKFDF